MKKYLFLAIALLGLASCAKDDIANGNNPIHNGEIEESYIAINLSASDITRATHGGIEDGTTEERAVHHVDFFFFDGDGEAFPVNVNNGDGTTSAPGDKKNYLRAVGIEFGADENQDDDISDSSKAVLLLKTYKGEYPSQIVAVLNWSPGTKESYTLGELQLAVNTRETYDEKSYFIMSNAVYAQNGKAVYATPLTLDNIQSTEEAAKNAPVTIYVERVAAKVKVTAKNSNVNSNYANNVFDLNKTFTDGEESGAVYAQILGWDLYRDNTQSTLLKVIEPTWTVDQIGFNWNDSPWYRSYWATSLVAPTEDTIHKDKCSLQDGNYTYIGENTTGKSTCTKVIIKAQLSKQVTTTDDETSYSSLEIALWNNVQYVGELALRTAVANTLKNTFYAKTTVDSKDVYTGLKPEDLMCVAGGGEGAPGGVEANEVYFQLSTEVGAKKNWYELVNGVWRPVSTDLNKDDIGVNATNELLKSVPSAVLYTNGETFYYVDIEHLGAPNSAAEYGIVRNHIYDIAINSIRGYGSPVYEGSEIIEYPTTPDQQTYVSAKINILSWRLVNQVVDIQPNN